MKKTNKKLIKRAKSFKSKLVKLMKNAKLGKSITGEQSFTTIGDVSDLIRVCGLIEKGKLKQAHTSINNLNAFVAQMLPNSIYNKFCTQVIVYE